MTTIPREDPEAFAQYVKQFVDEKFPHLQVELDGCSSLIINMRHYNLDDLRRIAAAYDDDEAAQERIEYEIERMFRDGFSLEDTDTMPWNVARTRILPKIKPDSIFESLSRRLVAHSPFVNDTVIVYVIDLPQATVSITNDQCARWGVTVEELDEIARKNLAECAPDLDCHFVESAEGGMAMLFYEQDAYDSARILLPNLHEKLAPKMGADFYVAIPARDVFIAFSTEPPALRARLIEKIRKNYEQLPYPISPDLYVVTRDGIAGTEKPSLDPA